MIAYHKEGDILHPNTRQTISRNMNEFESTKIIENGTGMSNSFSKLSYQWHVT